MHFKRYKPSDPYRRLAREVTSSDWAIDSILLLNFGLYRRCDNNEWAKDTSMLEVLNNRNKQPDS